jgi:peptidoglycan/xylan/chitin deacetylase (PgdA/CDA1 family)
MRHKSYYRYIALAALVISVVGLVLLYLELKPINAISSKLPVANTSEKSASKEASSPDVASTPVYLTVVMYHYVEVVTDKKDFIRKRLAVTPTAFEKQLIYLQTKGYTFYFAKDIPQLMSNPQEKPVVLTFDDGYADFYTDAYPILKKYNIKATIYIIYNFIGHPNYMTESQLQELAKSNLIEIGCHTFNHYSLPSSSSAVAQNEIINSKAALEKKFGIKIYTFAYPYGAYNASLELLAKQAGYTVAVTTAYGIDHTTASLLAFSRVRPGFIGGKVFK